MKSKSIGYVIKFIISLLLSIISFLVNAQSITGKWKLTDAKEIITDKSTGKTQDLSAQIKPMLKIMEQVFTFNTDNTYSFSSGMAGEKDKIEGRGTYSVSGNQLKLNQSKTNMPAVDKKYLSDNMNAVPPVATIVSHTSATLVLHYSSETTEKGKTFLVDIEDTFTKQ